MAGAERGLGHYGGTLLTLQECCPAGSVTTYRVVDGQQRLTTVSIFLSCIADKLGPEGRCGDWTAQFIRNSRLLNPEMLPEKCRKLRLQAGDEKEYRDVLYGKFTGAGAVTQVWKTISRLVAQKDVDCLLQGLGRLRVVSIGLDEQEDPQQIFESLNATDRSLTESEKVLQEELHDHCWLKIEEALGARDDAELVDIFLRDLLRWWTGDLRGIDKSYEGLRWWAIQQGHAADHPALLRELVPLTELYGFLTGTNSEHPDRNVQHQLRHIQMMWIDAHRPLSLRLLHDANRHGTVEANEALADVLSEIGAWLTYLWLADRRTSGLNRVIVDISSSRSLGEDDEGGGRNDKFVDYWLERISMLRNTQLAVPNDEEVREGIRTRQAYGTGGTKTTFSILYAMMENDHREESPTHNHLTIEHVMPQKLTDGWKRALREEADEIHRRYHNCLANLVLSGDATNAILGVQGFEDKKQVYRNSSIGMNRRVADEVSWGEEELDQRTEDLADQALSLYGHGHSPDSPAAKLETMQRYSGGASTEVTGILKTRRVRWS